MPDANPPDKKPFLGLSLTQLVGGSAAAATAAVLGSRLGTAGTIVGAALVSVISAVASAAYTASLRRTQEVVVRTREMLPTAAWGTGVRARMLPDVPDQPDGSDADAVEIDDPVDAAPGPESLEEQVEAQVEAATPSLWSRITWKSVAVAAGAFFVITALVVTGTELLTGSSLDGTHRTTLDGAVNDGRSPSTTRPTPTPTPSTSPTTSPSATPSSTPTDTASASPTPSATPTDTTPSPSSSPTGTASPGVTPTVGSTP